ALVDRLGGHRICCLAQYDLGLAGTRRVPHRIQPRPHVASSRYRNTSRHLRGPCPDGHPRRAGICASARCPIHSQVLNSRNNRHRSTSDRRTTHRPPAADWQSHAASPRMLARMDTPDLKEILDFAIDAARQAGELTLRYFQTSFDIVTKADDSPVTIADRGAEELLR